MRNTTDTMAISVVLVMIIQSVKAKSSCGGSIVQDQGEITSPNYPKQYPHNIYCEWNIKASRGKIIEMTMEDFQLEGKWLRREKYGCQDYLYIHDTDGTMLLNECGISRNMTTIRSNTDAVWVYFNSDETGARKGFRMKWKAFKHPSSIKSSTVSTLARTEESIIRTESLKSTHSPFTTSTGRESLSATITLATRRNKFSKRTLTLSSTETMGTGQLTTKRIPYTTLETIISSVTNTVIFDLVKAEETEEETNEKLYILLVLIGIGFLVAVVATIAICRCKAKIRRMKQAQKDDEKQNSENENSMWKAVKRLSLGPGKQVALNVIDTNNKKKETNFSKRFKLSKRNQIQESANQTMDKDTKFNMSTVQSGHTHSKQEHANDNPGNDNYESVQPDDYEKCITSTNTEKKKDVQCSDRMPDNNVVSGLKACTQHNTSEVAKSNTSQNTPEKKSYGIAEAVNNKINLKNSSYDMTKAHIAKFDVSYSMQKTREMSKTPVNNFEVAKAPINIYEFAKARVDNCPLETTEMNKSEVAKAKVSNAEIEKNPAVNYEMVNLTKQMSESEKTLNMREDNLHWELKKMHEDRTSCKGEQRKEFDICPIADGNYYILSESSEDERKHKCKLARITDNKTAGRYGEITKDSRTNTSEDNVYYALSYQSVDTKNTKTYELAQIAQTYATENDNYFVLTKPTEIAKESQKQKEVSDYYTATWRVPDTAKSTCDPTNADEGIYEKIRTSADDLSNLVEQSPRFATPGNAQTEANIYESPKILTSADKLRNRNQNITVSTSPYDVSENIGGEYDHITLKTSKLTQGNSLMDRLQKFKYT